MKRTILWIAVFLFLIPVTIAHSKATLPPIKEELIALLEDAFPEPPIIGNLKIDGNYALGILLLRVNGDVQEGEGKLFLAKWTNFDWILAIEGGSLFISMIKEVPETLIPEELRENFILESSAKVDYSMSYMDETTIATGYKLPWSCGQRLYVRQDWDSHPINSRGVAIDVDMSLGTVITAAASGVVTIVREDSNKCGCNPSIEQQGNYITIRNDAGYYDTYVHIRQGGAIPAVGDRVYQGQPIAYSHKTGYTCGSRAVCDPGTCVGEGETCKVYAHLHFHVQNASGARMRPVFDDVGEVNIGYYTSGNCPPAIPGIPTGLTASDGTYTDRVQLNWNAVSGATSYQIFRSTSSTGIKFHVATHGTNSYMDTSVATETTYWYWVKACNSNGCSDYSAPDTGYPHLPFPAIPTGLSATDGDYTNQVKLTWNAASWATSYEAYRSTSYTGTRTLMGYPVGTAWLDTSVVPGTTYWYWLKACNARGCSDYSLGDSGYARIPIPAIPTGLSASDGTYTDRVELTWASVSGATSYKVYRGTSGEPVQIGTATTNSYSDWTVEQVVTYWFWVTACNTNGCSGFSVGDTGYSLPLPPSTPMGLTASDGTFVDRVQVDWTSVSDAEVYQVFRAASETGTKVSIGTSTSTTFNDSTAVQGTYYWYSVKACNAGGCSDFSAQDVGHALLPVPDPPTGLSASDGAFIYQVQVNWAASTWASSYKVYRADSETGTKTQIGTATTNSYTDTTAVQGMVYWYWSIACNASGCSDFSEGDSGYALLPVPEPPTDLMATDGEFIYKVEVGWATVTWATSYQVFRSDSETGAKTQIGTPTVNAFIDTTAIQGITYWYWVKACNASGCSAYSLGESGYALLPVPAIPTGLTASDGTYTDRVQLAWSAITWSATYEVFRADSANAARTHIGTAETNLFADTTAVQGTTYWYWVKACNASGCGGFSAGDSGFARISVPQNPTSVSASDGTYLDKVVINWGGIDNATNYQVFRADSASGQRAQIGTATTNTYTDHVVEPGFIYWYWIKACNLGGCSDFSSGDSGFALNQTPDTPTNLLASDGTFGDKVQLTWQESENAISYNVYRSTSQSGIKALIGSTSSLVYDDTEVTVGATYWYWIKACVGSSCSDFSQPDSGYASLYIPGSPTNVKASDGEFAESIHISWQLVPSANSYNIYRALNEDGNRVYIASVNNGNYIDYSASGTIMYWYWIKACNNAGCSDFSLPDSGYLQVPTPMAPQSLTATDGVYTDKVKLTWAPVNIATSYEIFKASSQTAQKQSIGISDNANFDDFTGEQNIMFWYWVKACNDSGCSDFSVSDSGYRSAKRYYVFLPIVLRE